MPLDKNMSHEEMVSELIRSYKKSGKIGATTPRNMKHALEIANAVAYNIGEVDETGKVQEMKLTELLKFLETLIADKEKELGIMSEASVKVEFDNGQTLETEVDKETTDDDIKNRYQVGKEFNLKANGRDTKAKVKNVAITRNVGEDLEFIPTEIEFCDDENEEVQDLDTVTMDIPLFIRMLEWAREEANSDVDLHFVTENATKIIQSGVEILGMDNYDSIIGTTPELTVKDLSGAVDEMNSADMGADTLVPMKSKKISNTKKKHKRRK